MDGGLACHYLQTDEDSDKDSGEDSDEDSDEVYSVVVYNPIGKTLKELPPAPNHQISRWFPDLTLAVDSISHQYKIFLINQHIDILDHESTTSEERLETLSDPLLRIYDSVTNEWTSASTNPSCVTSCGVGLVSSVMFQGLLYVVLSYFHDFDYELWMYSILEDAWENVAVPISSDLASPKLLVSANRLFLIGWLFNSSSVDAAVWQLEASEIRIPDMDRERLFAMTDEYVMEVFGIKPGTDHSADEYPQMSAFGLGNSVMLMSRSSGNSLVYDLGTRSWDRLPPNPVGPLHWNDRCYVGKHMNLMLPNTLWWQEGQKTADHDQSAT